MIEHHPTCARYGLPGGSRIDCTCGEHLRSSATSTRPFPSKSIPCEREPMTEELEVPTSEDTDRADRRARREAQVQATLDRVAALNADDPPMAEHEEAALRATDAMVRPRDKADRVRELGKRYKAKIEGAALVRRMHETVAIAEARGEEPERLPSGAVQVINRDLLLAMVRKSRITVDQFDAAVEVRGLYEARSSGLGAMEYSDQGRGSPDNDAKIKAAIQRAKKLLRIGQIEMAVLNGYYRTQDGSLIRIEAFIGFKGPSAPQPHVALQMLRAVVGEGVAVSSFGEGRAVERHLSALRIALDIAAEVIGGKD
jgi:hypothetical protein